MSCEAIYCFDRRAVRFAIYPDGFDGPRVLAEITEDALRALFGAREGEASVLEACRSNFDVIQMVAVAEHRASPGSPVALDAADFSLSSAAARGTWQQPFHAARAAQ